jgi:hypothetical protein
VEHNLSLTLRDTSGGNSTASRILAATFRLYSQQANSGQTDRQNNC